MVTEVDRLGSLQMRVAGQRPVEVALGDVGERSGEPSDPLDRLVRVRAHEHRHIGRDLVIARPRRVQPATDGPDDLGQAPLDRHVDVLVAVGEREGAGGEFGTDNFETTRERVAVLGGDDPLGREHARVRDGLIDVVGTQPPVERDRIVQAAKRIGLRLGEAAGGHCRSTARSPSATRCTWPSVIIGKNGSAIDRAATSSQTGNSPSLWPYCSR